MAIEPYALPYTPNLVPQTRIEGEVTPDKLVQQIINLERFLAEELERIEEGLRFVPVQAAYAALLVDPGPAPDQPMIKDTPTPITGFNAFSPAVPNRVTASALGGADSLQVLEGGVYWVQVQITADITSGTSYVITIFINGTSTGIFGAVAASNQTDVITLTLYGLVSLNPGDLATVVVVATAAPAGPFEFIMQSATFSVVRVSEEHAERI